MCRLDSSAHRCGRTRAAIIPGSKSGTRAGTSPGPQSRREPSSTKPGLWIAPQRPGVMFRSMRVSPSASSALRRSSLVWDPGIDCIYSVNVTDFYTRCREASGCGTRDRQNDSRGRKPWYGTYPRSEPRRPLQTSTSRPLRWILTPSVPRNCCGKICPHSKVAGG